MLSQFWTLVFIAVGQLFSPSKFLSSFNLLKVSVFWIVLLLPSMMLCRQAPVPCLRGGCISQSTVFLAEKCAIDKLLWHQQRAFVARVVIIPHLRGRKHREVGWALPPLCFAFQAFTLLTFLGLLALSPVVAADVGAKRNAALERKDAEAFWLGGSHLLHLGAGLVLVAQVSQCMASPTYAGGWTLLPSAWVLCTAQRMR